MVYNFLENAGERYTIAKAMSIVLPWYNLSPAIKVVESGGKRYS